MVSFELGGTTGDWRGRRVLVTGARGLLGRHLAPLLAAAGARVVGTTRGRPAPGAVEDAELRSLDLGSAGAVRAALEDVRPHLVCHLAGASRPALAAADPAGTLEANVRGTWTLLDAIRLTDPAIESVLVSTLGAARRSGASNPYATSKACAELVGRMYADTFGLRIGVVRCPHVYGPDGDPARLVTAIVTALVAGEPVRLQQPRRRFDLLFVADAAGGIAAAARGRHEPGLRTYELSSGHTVEAAAVADLARDVLEGGRAAAGHPPPVRAGCAPPGWMPCTPLAEGLAAMIAWRR